VMFTAAEGPGTVTPMDSPIPARLTAETDVGLNRPVADPPAGTIWLPGAL